MVIAISSITLSYEVTILGHHILQPFANGSLVIEHILVVNDFDSQGLGVASNEINLGNLQHIIGSGTAHGDKVVVVFLSIEGIGSTHLVRVIYAGPRTGTLGEGELDVRSNGEDYLAVLGRGVAIVNSAVAVDLVLTEHSGERIGDEVTLLHILIINLELDVAGLSIVYQDEEGSTCLTTIHLIFGDGLS